MFVFFFKIALYASLQTDLKKKVFSLTDFIHDKKFYKYSIKLDYVWLIQKFYSIWSFFSLKIFLMATSFWLFPPVSLIWVLLSVTLSCVITHIFQNNSICQFIKYTSNIITLRVCFFLMKLDWSSLKKNLEKKIVFNWFVLWQTFL